MYNFYRVCVYADTCVPYLYNSRLHVLPSGQLVALQLPRGPLLTRLPGHLLSVPSRDAAGSLGPR